MYISDKEIIKKISKKWNVTKKYLPLTLIVKLKDNDTKYINLIHSLDFLVSDENNEYDYNFLKKIIDYINDEKIYVDHKGYLMLDDKVIECIILNVCKKKDYHSLNKIHFSETYIWPLDIQDKNYK